MSLNNCVLGFFGYNHPSGDPEPSEESFEPEREGLVLRLLLSLDSDRLNYWLDGRGFG